MQHELKALEHTKNQLATLLKFEDKKARYRKSFIVWDGLERANKKKKAVRRKSSKISKNASALIAPAMQNLKKGKPFIINHKYISSITITNRRQNLNILNELTGVFDITYHAHIIVNGKSYYRSYEFSLKQLSQENEAHLEGDIAQLISPSISRNACEQAVSTTPIENNNTESIRSIAQAHESIFYNNSNSSSQTEAIEFAKTRKVVSRKKVLVNVRKKLTNAERKAKVYSLKFKQYEQPKTLGDHYPLSQEDCRELQNKSGREFALNAMNEILQDMARKPKLSSRTFPSKAAFMAYMSEVYRYEGRDTVKTANLDFKILTRATKAEIIQHTTQAERERYLAEVEQRAITHRSDETQYRAKLANTMPLSQAYSFLSNMRTVRKVAEILEIIIEKRIDLTESSKEVILAQANAVGGYRGVKKLEICIQI